MGRRRITCLGDETTIRREDTESASWAISWLKRDTTRDTNEKKSLKETKDDSRLLGSFRSCRTRRRRPLLLVYQSLLLLLLLFLALAVVAFFLRKRAQHHSQKEKQIQDGPIRNKGKQWWRHRGRGNLYFSSFSSHFLKLHQGLPFTTTVLSFLMSRNFATEP